MPLDSLPRNGILFCLAGPSGVGKTTVVERVLAVRSGLARSISTTSRAARSGEVAGVDYQFVSAKEFRDKVDNDEFVEWEEVHGNLYGTLRSSISNAIEAGTDLVLVIDIKGSLRLKQLYPMNCVICFLAPPKFSMLQQRIETRMVEGGTLDCEVLERRLETARIELDTLINSKVVGAIDYLIVNDNLEKACSEVVQTVDVERRRVSRFDPTALQQQFVDT